MVRSIRDNGRYILAAMAAAVWLVIRYRRWVYMAIFGGVAWRIYTLAAGLAIVLYALMPVPVRAQAPSIYQGMYMDVFTGGYDGDAAYWCFTEGHAATYSGAVYFPKIQCVDVGLELVLDGGDYVLTSEPAALFGLSFYDPSTAGIQEKYTGVLYMIPPRGAKSVTIACVSHGWRSHSTYASFGQQVRRDSFITRTDIDGVVEIPGSFTVKFTRGVRNWDYWLPNLGTDVADTTLPASSPFRFDVTSSAWFGSNREAEAGIVCQVVGLEVDPDWGDDTWYPLPPLPTPVPTGHEWEVTPWVPVTDTTNMPDIGISEPLTTTCGVIIPEYSWGWYSSTYGWSEVELCYEEREIGIQFLGFNIGGYLLVTFLLAGVGVLVSIIKRA